MGQQSPPTAPRPGAGAVAGASPGPGTGASAAATADTPPDRPAPGGAAHLAAVERGRIATMGGVVSVIWLVILVLMVWNS